MRLKQSKQNTKGYSFRSRVEARWAVFFDACGEDWEYEPKGYDLGDRLYYLPDFPLHGITIQVSQHPLVRTRQIRVRTKRFRPPVRSPLAKSRKSSQPLNLNVLALTSPWEPSTIANMSIAVMMLGASLQPPAA